MLDKIKRNKLQKSEILRKRKDFQQLFASPNMMSSPNFTIRYLETSTRKMGFIVFHDVSSKAVIRNRIRRYLKEIYRTNKDNFLRNYSYVFIARKNVVNKSYSEIKEEVLTLSNNVKQKIQGFN